MKQLFMWIYVSMTALLLAACGGDDGGDTSPDTGNGATTIVSLQITPPQGRIPVTLRQQYVAQAVLSDGKVQDVTSLGDVQWHTSDSAIATITSSGLATGVAPGRVTITASGVGANGAPIEAKAQLEISNAQVSGLQVTPPRARVAAGLNKHFTAILQLSDGTTLDVTRDVNWVSDDTTTATVNQGLATGAGAGMASLGASGLFQGKTVSGAAQLTVSDATVTSLQVTPATTKTAVGLALPFVATAVLSDGTSQAVTEFVSWSSDNTGIATISNEQNKWGQARGISAGSATIMASGYFNGQDLSGSAQLKVSSATVTSLQLTPPRLRAPIGLPAQYSATAMLSDGSSQPVLDASWSSSNPAMATISTAGQATGAHPGTTTLNASTTVNGQLFNGSAQLTVTDAVVTALQVTPARGSVPIGLAQQYDATALMSDGTSLPMTDSASWVSDSLIATVDKGLASGVSTGTTEITATAAVNGVSVSNTASLTVTGAEVTSLEVSPGIEAVPAGLTKPFTVRAWMSDGSDLDVTGNDNVSWSSDNSSIATVDGSTGVATGVATGSAYITAAGSINGLFLSDSASLAVGEATVMGVEVTPDPASVTVGTDVQFTAIGQLSDNSTQDITSTASWGSDNTGVATVIGGLATGVSVGAASITATDIASGHSDSAALTVNAATITSLDVTPETATIEVGQKLQLTATATLSDGSTQDVTASTDMIGWTTSNWTVVQISSTGLATGSSLGSATITAMTREGPDIRDTAEVTVAAGCTMETLTDALGRIWTCPLTKSKADANGIAYSNTYTEYNGIEYALLNWEQADTYCTDLGGGYYLPSLEELQGLYNEFGSLGSYAGWPTLRFYWSSTMGTYAGTHWAFNLGTGADGGTRHDASNYENVTCVKPSSTPVVSLAVAPADSSTWVGNTQQFTAIATLSDGNVVDVSASVAWSSGNTTIATINGDGLATGVAIGSTTIAATMQDGSGLSNTTQLTVLKPLPNYGLGCDEGMLIDNTGASWTCPLLQSEADALGIPYQGVWATKGTFYAMMDWPHAQSYCANLGGGFYLAQLHEFQAFFGVFGSVVEAGGWPTGPYYWTGTNVRPGTYNAYGLENGNIADYPDELTFYVTCKLPAQ